MPKKLTREEFTKKVEELLLEEVDDNLNVMVLIYNDDGPGVKQDVHFTGHGCPACAVNVVFEGAVQGRFKHNGPEPDHKNIPKEKMN